MRVVVLAESEIGDFGADLVLHELRDENLRVLGAATGTSPLPVYQALEERWVPAMVELSVFALDEYVGLGHTHPQSYHSIVENEVVARLRLDSRRIHVPDGDAVDLEKAGRQYDAAIQGAGGIDLQILGIGSTGHIGFNEPGSSFASRTRVTALTDRTRRDNSRFFASFDEVPTHSITQGLGTIMEARKILLIARGAQVLLSLARLASSSRSATSAAKGESPSAPARLGGAAE